MLTDNSTLTSLSVASHDMRVTAQVQQHPPDNSVPLNQSTSIDKSLHLTGAHLISLLVHLTFIQFAAPVSLCAALFSKSLQI